MLPLRLTVLNRDYRTPILISIKDCLYKEEHLKSCSKPKRSQE